MIRHTPKVPKGSKEETDDKKEKKQESATAKKAKKEVKRKKEEMPEDQEENESNPGEGFSGDRGEELAAECLGEKNSSEDRSSDLTKNQSSAESEDEPENGDEGLNLLIYKRGQVKAKVTRIRSSLRTTQMNLPRVQVMQKNLQTYYAEYTNYHSEILDSVDK